MKLITGGMRIGVSARLEAGAGRIRPSDVTEIEELWHGLTPPYLPSSHGSTAAATSPPDLGAAPFRPVMLAHPTEDDELRVSIRPTISRRVEMGRHPRPGGGGERPCIACIRAPATTFPRPFPICSRRWISTARSMANCWSASRDGGLSLGTFLRPAAAAQPQDRAAETACRNTRRSCAPTICCGRRRRTCARCPCERAAHGWNASSARLPGTRFDLSPLVPFATWRDRRKARRSAGSGHRGRDAEAPRLRPMWPAARRGRGSSGSAIPTLVDAVLMYAQRGHGKRSSFYSDYTFGVWRPDDDPNWCRSARPISASPTTN